MLHLTISRPHRGAARIVLDGDLDRTGADAIACLTGAIATEVDEVVLDLSGLHFVDIGGWRALEEACATLGDHGVNAVVDGVSAAADRFRSLLATVRS